MAKIKRLFNDPYDVEKEFIEGYLAAHKDYVEMCDLDEAQGRVVLAKGAGTKDKVGVIIGGGSGHEPLFIGYVGEDFADAVVIGNINTSPSPDPCYAAAKACDNGKGCIYLYGNYAGDVMNFDMGAEQADEEDDIRVETVLVTDDVVSSKNIPDRRGIAGDFFVFKVAAAKAATGADLDEVVAAATKANDWTRTMGVALSSATLPSKGDVIFELPDGAMEIGMGIHGEPGVRRGEIRTADEVVDEIMPNILEDVPYVEGDEVYVLVNSLGATPLIDLHICYRRVAQILEEKGIKVYKALVGPFACSMDMAGMSITLMKLDDELKELMDAPCDAPYFTQK
ncbi:MAG: dihydroxyacetone kinase subunit DhaK [Eubacteriales bacterium]|nr:dihydroxyacetone kinase subunit DhaK [Eubacteriales bacterium]